MKSMKYVVLLTVGMAFLASGCISRAIKEGAGAVMGAKGVYAQDDGLGSKNVRPLGRYTSFKVGTITTHEQSRDLVPPRLRTLTPIEIRKYLLEKRLPVGDSANALTINMTVFYYEKAGMTGQVFGPFEEAVSQVELVDSNGQVRARTYVIGRSTTTTNQGVDKKAEGLGKGVADWIDSRYPEEVGRLPKE